MITDSQEQKEQAIGNGNDEESAEETALEEAALAGIDITRVKAMSEAGLCYGKSKAKTHPKMRPFILTTRNGVEIIDVVQTAFFLRPACQQYQ